MLTSDAQLQSARKYEIPESSQELIVTPEASNNDAIVSLATGLRSLSMVLGAVSQQAAQDVLNTRGAIESSLGSNTSGSTNPRQMTEDDVTQNQNRLMALAAPGLPSLQSFMLNRRVSSTLSDAIISSRHTVMPIATSGLLNVENKITPDIDQTTVELRRGKGVLDAFTIRVTFSVPTASINNGDVKYLRVFRAEASAPGFARPLGSMSLRGMGIISSFPLTYRSKNDDKLSMLEHHFNDAGISNELTTFNPFDRFTKRRVVASSSSFAPLSGNIDPSVAENPQFMDARRLQDPNFGSYKLEDAVVIGRSDSSPGGLGSAHVGDLNSQISKFQFAVNPNNNANFKQIFAAIPSGFGIGNRIGSRIYYTYDDTAVTYGHRYQYYVVSVNKNMVQSNRSPIISVDLDGLRVPPAPRKLIAKADGVFVTLMSSVDDQLVEKFEIWKKEVTPSTNFNPTITSIDNGFSLVDEMLASEQESGANWIDRYVVPGRDYIYRVYSVDIFGNKSELPAETSVSVPQKGDAVDTSLGVPSILAEVDSKTQKMKITIYCDDPNVKKIRLERRDLTIDQQNFSVPTDCGRTVIGELPVKHSSFVHGERVQSADSNLVWTGYFDNTGKVDFVDKLVSFDRTYQYRVYGIASNGSRTSYDYSRPVLVYRRPMINTPVNFSATFVTGSSGGIAGVLLTWNSSSLDLTAEDRFGSQISLLDTATRTLYQIERQKKGDRWLRFNLTSGSQYFDPVGGPGVTAPEYRPPFLELNSTYEYRLQAVLSGGYISNKTDQISVFVTNNIRPPQNLTLTSPDPRLRPFYIMLNWNTDPLSGPVDHWVIERAEVNNFAAARINVKNADDFTKLNFKPFRTVYRESSRFRSFKAEMINPTIRTSIIVGQHHFLDAQITMGNTYFYRVIAVDTRGNTSTPVYRGMKVTYASYERMIDEVISESTRTLMSQRLSPARVITSFAFPSPVSTTALNPRFSAPQTTLQLVPFAR